MNAASSCTSEDTFTVHDSQQFIRNASVLESQPSPSPTCQSTAIPRVCLPDPPSLYRSLIAVGAEERTAREMDRAYNARALQLRSYYEISIHNAFAASTNSPFPCEAEKRILDTFANLYLARIKPWIEEGVIAYKRCWNPVKQLVNFAEASRSANPRRVFNADYVPLLEHFFNENPLPSHADKLFLAKKSGMTYRQIHVWFQNRRNRLKKMNGTWRRKPTSEGAILPLDNLRERMEKYAVHTKQVSNPPLETCRLSQKSMKKKLSLEKVSDFVSHLDKGTNVLDKCGAPLHAFPSPYPPTCSYEPFPLKSPTVFQWKIHPNHNISQSCIIGIDDLAHRFSLLSVRDTCPQKTRVTQDSHAATYSITVIPPPAPHPALIKRVKDAFSPASLLPIARTSQPTPKAFTASFSSSTSNSLPSSENDITSLRRDSPFALRRHPHQFPLPCRSVTPATSNVTSFTPSHCPSSCSSDSLGFEGGTGPRTRLSPFSRLETRTAAGILHSDAQAV